MRIRLKTVNPKKPSGPECFDFHNAIAKTVFDTHYVEGISVLEHCTIVGKVARHLLGLLPSTLRNKIFPRTAELIAAAHDLGKISPLFMRKIAQCIYPDNWRELYPALCDFDHLGKEVEWQYGGHSTISFFTLEALAGESYAICAGQHHGILSPVADSSLMYSATCMSFGGEAWERSRELAFRALEHTFGVAPHPAECLSDVQILALSGLVTVSDWIGSGDCFENARPSDDISDEQIEQAVAASGFTRHKIKNSLTFEEIFGFPPNGIQKTFIGIANKPGVYILEAPMGCGKTEAALMAAYHQLSAGTATGIYFALPTRTTSNSMHGRFERFLTKVVDGDSESKALLLHSSASLATDTLGDEARPGHGWFDFSNRGLLYPFSVGTIDQALMSVMDIRHSFVRFFGLVGKVVIIDELHSYDAYTGRILDHLVKALRLIGCTVIILSATITSSRKSELLKLSCDIDLETPDAAYPLITSFQFGKQEVTQFAPAWPSQDNADFYFRTEQDCLKEAISRAASGQQVIWIENTIDDAQRVYKQIAWKAKSLGCETGLIHSRFTASDREDRERHWLSLLGKGQDDERRRRGRILVGTQVLEQSVDVDADFMVTRLAPTDLMLQRMGRLWRHASTYRPDGACRDLWIIDVSLEEAVKGSGMSFGASRFVYAPYVLCRTLEAWKEIAPEGHGSVRLYEDVRTLIEKTYALRDETGEMASVRSQLVEGERRRGGRPGTRSQQKRADSVLSTGGKIRNDQNIATRDTGMESFTILPVKEFIRLEGRSTKLLLNDGSSCDLLSSRVSMQQRRRTAALLTKNSVTCSGSRHPEGISMQRAKELGLNQYLYLGDSLDPYSECPLALMELKKSGSLSNLFSTSKKSVTCAYSRELGLTIVSDTET